MTVVRLEMTLFQFPYVRDLDIKHHRGVDETIEEPVSIPLCSGFRYQVIKAHQAGDYTIGFNSLVFGI